ncbi:MAG: hypothetical protein NZM38_04695 [Cytophagales bacterium]|nr:hypothetical protein [Cytophagales bacterium]MDW8384052.1 CheR family methyltransferase [Flammeovirgaceae bacterium]
MIDEASISDEEIMSINRAILLRYGIDFTNYEINSLKRRIVRIINKYRFENTIGLWKHLLKDSQFIFTYIDEITVGLTEMFRNPDLWIKFRDDILPKLSCNSTIYMWHAGCSTGEEVYTASIVLHEQNLRYCTYTLASDINRTFVAKAQSGCYEADLLQQYQKNYLTFNPNSKKGIFEYFDSLKNSEFCVKAFVRQNISFVQHSLLEPLADSQGRFDVIFCRNVLIYFDDTLKLKVLQLFYQTLHPDGFLILGYFDSLSFGLYQPYFEMVEPAYKILRRK